MRMSFGPPLKTGWAGDDEYMDVFLETGVDAFADRVNARLPEGLLVRDCVAVDDGEPKLANDICAATYEVRVAKENLSDSRGPDGETLDGAEEILLERFAGAGEDRGDCPHVSGITIWHTGDDVRIEYTSTVLGGRVVTPHDIVAAWHGDPETFRVPMQVVRKAQYVVRNGEYVSPLTAGIVQG